MQWAWLSVGSAELTSPDLKQLQKHELPLRHVHTCWSQRRVLRTAPPRVSSQRVKSSVPRWTVIQLLVIGISTFLYWRRWPRWTSRTNIRPVSFSNEIVHLEPRTSLQKKKKKTIPFHNSSSQFENLCAPPTHHFTGGDTGNFCTNTASFCSWNQWSNSGYFSSTFFSPVPKNNQSDCFLSSGGEESLNLRGAVWIFQALWSWSHQM